MLAISLLCILGLFALGTTCYGIKRYRTPLNPLSIFSITQVGLFTVLSSLVAIYVLKSDIYTTTDIEMTLIISLVYLFGATVPYFFNGTILSKLFGKMLFLLKLNSNSVPSKFSFSKFVLLLIIAVGAFVALALYGGGGMLWITNTREAYISYRAGAGLFFALTQWLLTFAMLYIIWTTKPTTLKLVFILLSFCWIMSFLGSKNNILTLVIIVIAYYNFYIKKIRLVTFSFIGAAISISFLYLLVAQGSYQSFSESVKYFKDYFDTTAQFISRFNEFDLRYGGGWLSSLWFYVPRGVYPDKPYEYGFTLIHQVLFPAAAASGHTPGLLMWSLAYLDFGVIGVFSYGLFIGMLQRMAYEYFILHRQQYFAFVLAMQLSIWPIWSFSTLIITILLSISQSIYLKLTWRNKFKAI